jgi:SAM-dependent methyltransferase
MRHLIRQADVIAARAVRQSRRSLSDLRSFVEARAGQRHLSERAVTWTVREAFEFRGRCHVRGTVAASGALVDRVQLCDGSAGFLAAALNGSGEDPFNFELCSERLASPTALDQVRLRALLGDGTRAEHCRLVDHAMAADPYHQLTHRFFAMCRAQGERSGGTVLEVGSRARSGHVRRQMVEPMKYVGLDLVPGENTDLVGDAHRLGELLEPASIDAVFALSTFEHLAMPWKAVVEMNRVLRPGGLAFVSSHHTFPLHDTPWDFWRFSSSAWHALFNAATGFRVIDTAMGEPAMIVPALEHAVTRGLAHQPASLASAVLAEKIGETTLDWPVDLSDIMDGGYPG